MVMYVSLVASHQDQEWYRSVHMEFGRHSAVTALDSLTKWLKLSADSLVLIQNVFNLLYNYSGSLHNLLYVSCSIAISIFHDGRYYNHILPVVWTGSVTCNGNEPNIAHCKLISCSSDCKNGFDVGIKCDYSKKNYTNNNTNSRTLCISHMA